MGTELEGDNDPLDVVEVGSRIRGCGEIYQAKVLGILGMIDEGEMDWKVIAIATDDPDEPHISTIADLEAKMPGKVKSIVDWFKMYKTPDGKPVNQFAFNDEAKDTNFALQVIDTCHRHWKDTANIKTCGLWTP